MIARFPKDRDALLNAGAKPEAHIYQAGGHGFAIKRQGTTSDHWTQQLMDWLRANAFLPKVQDAKAQDAKAHGRRDDHS